ncbi:phosphatase PAP2 family protein [Arthrobacter sp. MDT1-48-3]
MSEHAPLTRAKRGIPADRFILSYDLTHWHTRLMQRFVAFLFRLSSRIGAVVTLAVVLLTGVLLILGTATGATELYEATVEGDGAQLLDTPALQAAMAMRSPPVDEALTAYTTIGGPIGMSALAGTIMIVLAIRRRSWTPVVLIVLAAAGSVLITVVSKQFIGRARPPLSNAIPPYEYSDSFPSGHALNSLVLAGIIAYLLMLRRRTRRTVAWTAVIAILFAITMGISRVYLGHHWLTDVLMAWALGSLWLTIVITTHRLYLTSKLQSGIPRMTVNGEDDE